jgi:threonine/homoserine/homoserine lactone efflux protein
MMGLLMGFAVVLPVGPLNLEIIRRALRFGALEGIILGLGAIAADIIYLFLLSVGYLSLLNNAHLLHIIGIVGSFIIAYFGYRAIVDSSSSMNNEKVIPQSYFKQGLQGFLIAFFNPFVILFWLSLSSQIAALTNNSLSLFALTAFGVVLSAIIWLVFLNTLIHFTKNKLNHRFIKTINWIGGLLLIGIAIYGFIDCIHQWSNVLEP